MIFQVSAGVEVAMLGSLMCDFFFFQAEDGIRDLTVTGVQTCALPILFLILRDRRQQLAGTLSGGQQKMLGLARGIALQPKLLMVDEPTEGLMPANVEIGRASCRERV